MYVKGVFGRHTEKICGHRGHLCEDDIITCCPHVRPTSVKFINFLSLSAFPSFSTWPTRSAQTLCHRDNVVMHDVVNSFFIPIQLSLGVRYKNIKSKM